MKQDVDIKLYFDLPEKPLITIIAPIKNEPLVLKKKSIVFLEIKAYCPYEEDKKEIETETKKPVQISIKDDFHFQIDHKKNPSNVSKVSKGKKVFIYNKFTLKIKFFN